MNRKLLRITTVSESLRTLLPGQMAFMQQQGFTVWSASAGVISHPECPHFTLPLTRQITPFQDLYALWKTYRLIRRLRPDIVHTHTPKAGLIGMWAARWAGVPVRLHTVAGLPLMERRGLWRWLFTQIERLTYAFATEVWPNSFGLETYIRQHLYNGPKLRVIGNGSSNGIDTIRFRPTSELTQLARMLRKQLSIAPDVFVWLFVGRIVGEKGITELVTAFRAVSEKQPDTRLVLVGQEESLNLIDRTIKSIIVSDKRILEVGYQTDVRPYIMMANALILPSYREGLPNVLLQAACLERPVVATDIVGCREVVQQGETGLLVPPKDPFVLHDAMLRLMNDTLLRQQMSGKARAHVVEKYEQKTLWQALLLAYNQALRANQSECTFF